MSRDDFEEFLVDHLPWLLHLSFAVVRKERELEVYRAIRRLPPEERAIMMLVVQGFTWREVADALGVAVADVRNGMLRARRRLRELRELREEGGDDE